ncbi:MAG TPA: 23S rRNA pseudouridine(1911/1915/1917) synthase RluD [Pseudomonadales bacterium]
MKEKISLANVVTEAMAGYRLDQAVADLFPEYSRARLQQWIKSGDLKVDGAKWKPRQKVQGGEKIAIEAELKAETSWEAEAIPLNILYEDEEILVLNKPVGMVVHPAVGNRAGTLLNALLHYRPQFATLPRAGIVHRLDKDTSGLMVVAKTLTAHNDLVEQLQARSVSRQYEAITVDVMTGGGKVEEPIGRHSHQRTKMAVTASGKEAITHYRVVERFRGHTHIRLKLETGRTHQIRVHMAHIHYPLVGDPVYGGRLKLPKGVTTELVEGLQNFKRQALHASKLGLAHPESKNHMEWEQPMPDDMLKLIDLLRDDARLANDA